MFQTDDSPPPFGLKLLRTVASCHPKVIHEASSELGQQARLGAKSTYDIKFYQEPNGSLSAVKIFNCQHFNEIVPMKELVNEIETARMVREIPAWFESPLAHSEIIVPSSLQWIGVRFLKFYPFNSNFL